MLMGVLRRFFRDVVVPEIALIRAENTEIKTTLQLTNKRLDDMNAHLVDQGRRMDALREELGRRIDETNRRIDAVREQVTQRIDETNQQIDAVREQLTQRIDEANKHIFGTNQRLDSVHGDVLTHIDAVNDRLNRLYEVIVRREEHDNLAQRLTRLEQKVEEMAARDAA